MERCYACGMYDVVIAGGGLAGAATAYHLASAGRRVVVLERSATYQRKACGEGLFPRGVRELERLGLLDEIRPRGMSLTGVRFHNEAIEVAAPFGRDGVRGLGVQRSALDPRMLEHARAAGVEVRTGLAVQGIATSDGFARGVQTSEGTVEARVVVGADGIGSRIRKQAGLDRARRWRGRRRYGVSAHLRLDHDAGSTVDVYFHDGYELYVTPVAERVVNLAVLVHRRLLRTARGDLAAWFKGMIERDHPAFGAAQLLDGPIAAGPFATGCVRPWRSNLVLVGDAAGFFDAINGEGMSLTLVSARDCAAAVDAYLRTNDEAAFERYSRQRRALVRDSEWLARLSLTLAARPAVARLAIKHLARRPSAFARLVAISSGELPLRALRPSDVRALLLGI